MSDKEFNDTVIAGIVSIQTNIKWIMKIGGIICVLAGLTAGTLWLRTESNALTISTVEASMVQHIKEVDHEKMD